MTTEEDFFNRSVNDYEGYFSYASQDVLIEDLKSLVHDLENVSVYKKRSVSYNKELLAAYGLWVKGNSQGEIYPFLRNSSEYERVGQRTITRWVRWFKDIPQKDVELDRAGFYFHNMENYGIPYEKYEEVLWLVEQYARDYKVDLTPRMAKWALRLQNIKKATFDKDKAMEFIKRYVAVEQEELIGVESREDLNKVSSDLQLEVSQWTTRPIGRTV